MSSFSRVFSADSICEASSFPSLPTSIGTLPVTEQAMREVISLPVYPELTDTQQDAVIAQVAGFYR